MTETKRGRPAVNSEGQRELDKVDTQMDAFQKDFERLSDRKRLAPTLETEDQTQITRSEIRKAPDVYLKPSMSVSSNEKFNPKFDVHWQYDKQYVRIIAENKESPGELIEMWTKPYPGLPAEFWKIPVNTPVHMPRHVAEQLKRKFYNNLSMEESTVQPNSIGMDGYGAQYYGKLVVTNSIQRLDARDVDNMKPMISMRS